MMRKAPGIVTAIIALTTTVVPVRASSSSFRDDPGRAHRWLRNPIIISLSPSLAVPPPNVKADTDVAAALRRALHRWESAAGIQFMETNSTNEAISPPNAGDGVNLITLSPVNAATFGSSDTPGQTRVFYDSGGTIIEADICLNPRVLFSDDGTPGTYDLESTLAHEVGHLLGLEHSAIIGATMQPRQARNGVYGFPAISQRSLSEDDYTRVHALYSDGSGISSISGRLTTSLSGRVRNIFGAHVFAEDVATGKVVTSSISTSAGNYRLEGLAPGVYRVFGESLNGAVPATDIAASGPDYSGLTETTPLFRSFIGSASTPSQSLNLSANSAAKLSFIVLATRAPKLVPRLIGMNGELSTAALPLKPGESFTVYVAGENVDLILGEGISTSSPLIQVDPSSLKQEDFGTPYPVISFVVTVSPNISPGDFTIRLQSPDGERAFLPGAITIE
jgi:hypothetical protein